MILGLHLQDNQKHDDDDDDDYDDESNVAWKRNYYFLCLSPNLKVTIV